MKREFALHVPFSLSRKEGTEGVEAESVIDSPERRTDKT
jgi:hypothetical protein